MEASIEGEVCRALFSILLLSDWFRLVCKLETFQQEKGASFNLRTLLASYPQCDRPQQGAETASIGLRTVINMH